MGLSIGLTWAAEDLRNTEMDRQSLHEYALAKCSDGSAAAYYIEKVTIFYRLFDNEKISHSFDSLWKFSQSQF